MKNKSHLIATLQALLVTMIWSTSFMIIKKFIDDIPPLSFASLRYTFGFLFLLPALIKQRESIKALEKRDWRNFAILGLVYIGITQGAQFFALKYVEMTTISLVLTFTAPLVAIIGIFMLKESVLPQQWLGTAILIAGAMLYFSQKEFAEMHLFGMVMVLIGLVANSFGTVLGRSANRELKHNATLVTGISMFFGSIVLLAAAFAIDGIPQLSWKEWLVVLYIASVGTAFAFWLWNHSMRKLSAMETSVINNTMLIQIGVLAWLFFDERLKVWEIIGLVIALIGVVLVSVRFNKPGDNQAKSSTQELVSDG